MADNEITVNDQTEGASTANVDTKSMVGAGGKTVHRQVVTLGDNVTFGNTAEVNANSELLVKHTDSIAVTNANLDVALSTVSKDATSLLIKAKTDNLDVALSTRLNTLGQKTMANSAPVVIASDQSAVPVSLSQPISVDDNAGSLTVDAPTATPVPMAITSTADTLVKAGDAVNNAVRVNIVAGGGSGGDGAILDGVSSSIKASVLDYTNANPVAVRLTDTNGDYVGAGAGTQYTEDAVSSSDPTGTQLIARRRDALAGETSTDGDVVALNSTNKGELYVKHADAISISDNAARDNGKIDIAGFDVALPAGTNNIGDVDVLTLPNVTNAGTFAVQDSEKIADNGGFTDGTTKVIPVGLIYDEVAGTALTENDIGTPRMNVNRSAVGIIEDGVTRGRYATVSAANALKVDGSAVTQPVSDASGSLTVDAPVGTPVFTRLSDGAAALVGQKTMANSLPVVLSSDQASVPVAATLAAETTKVIGTINISASQTVTAAQSTASNLKAEVVGATADNAANPTTKLGVLPVVSTASPPTYTEGNVNPLSTTLTGILRTEISTWIGSTAPTIGSKTSANSLPVVIASDQGNVAVSQGTASSFKNEPAGNVADAASDSGNPIKIGAVGRTTNRTAVTDGQRVNVTGDDLGRLVIVPHQVRDLVNDQTTTITASTTETTIFTAVASVFNDLVMLTLANTSATATRVDFRDTTGGSVRFSLYVPAGATIGFVPQVPLKQATVNTNWTAQCGTSVTDVRIFVQVVRNI